MYDELYMSVPEEYEHLKRSVHEFSKEVLKPAGLALDKLSAQEAMESPIYWDVMKKGYELGYHKALLPEEYGGLGLDPLGAHILLEELGWGSSALGVSLAVSAFPAMGTCIFGAENQEVIDRFVMPYIEDTKAQFIGCWAITEPDHGSDWLMAHKTDDTSVKGSLKATKKGDAWVLNGQKSSWVSNGPVATHALLFPMLKSEIGMKGGGICVAPLNEIKGVSKAKPLEKMGQRALPQGEIFFEDAEIPSAWMIVDDEEVYPFAVEAVLATANAGMGAIFTGLARAAFEEALGYARTRVQGGKLLIEHQLVQHKLFEMFRRSETARYYSRAALIHNFSTMPPKTRYSITAKTYCTEAAFSNAHDAIQIFGGLGISKESSVEMLLRDAKLSMIEDGCNEVLGISAALDFAELDLD
jgi:alkylation response protein AidB-like acyl-CoA dehydrogenase